MLVEIQKDVPLSRYTTFRIGGPAKYFCVVRGIDEIKEALEFARKENLKIFVLGGGSNLLVSDRGFDGMVIRIQNSGFKIQNSNAVCGGGLPLAKLISKSVKLGLAGLEWAAGIPGTVGGAICNNAGANGGSMSDIVEEVEAVQMDFTGATRLWNRCLLTNKQCQFSYRDSLFRRKKNFIILNAVLRLKKGDKEKSRRMIAEYLISRKEKQPLEYPSAGSVFRNPSVSKEQLKGIIKEYPDLSEKCLTFVKGPKQLTVPAGCFIEALGLGGKKVGGAMISEKHCNFIVNTGDAKAEDVIILISLIKQKVRDNFGIQLIEEIEYVGF